MAEKQDTQPAQPEKPAAAPEITEAKASDGTTVLGIKQPEAPAPEKAKSDGLATPHEHAVAIGAYLERARTAVVGSQDPVIRLYSWQHAAAAALHGWAEHEHHEAAPIRLKVGDYKLALLAATNPVTRVAVDAKTDAKGNPVKAGEKVDSHKAAELGIPTTTTYEPHPPALSKHAPHAKEAGKV